MKQQQNDKERYLRYRERARDLYERAAVSYDPHVVHESIRVPLHANVQVCEGGAFVEAVVWVPEEKLTMFASPEESRVVEYAPTDKVKL